MHLGVYDVSQLVWVGVSFYITSCHLRSQIDSCPRWPDAKCQIHTSSVSTFSRMTSWGQLAVFRATLTGDILHTNRWQWIWIIVIIIVWSFCLLTIPGNHPKDSGHTQSPLYVVFRPASEQQPFQRAGSLASPWNGSFPCEGEIRAGTSHRGVEVRENQRMCYVHLRRSLVMGT